VDALYSYQDALDDRGLTTGDGTKIALIGTGVVAAGALSWWLLSSPQSEKTKTAGGEMGGLLEGFFAVASLVTAAIGAGSVAAYNKASDKSAPGHVLVGALVGGLTPIAIMGTIRLVNEGAKQLPCPAGQVRNDVYGCIPLAKQAALDDYTKAKDASEQKLRDDLDALGKKYDAKHGGDHNATVIDPGWQKEYEAINAKSKADFEAAHPYPM